MSDTSVAYRGTYVTAKPPSCVLSLAELRRLFRDLDVWAKEAAQRQLSTIPRPDNMSPEDFVSQKAHVLSASGVTVTVLGSNGEQIVGTTEAVFDEATLPENITQITFDSAFSYRTAMRQDPPDRFIVRFDFSEPPNFGRYDPWDEDTPNNSTVEVSGPAGTWVTAVYEGVLGFLRRRVRRRGWLHSTVFFNLANWVFAFPAAFWVVYRLDATFKATFTQLPTVLRGGVYIYLVLITLLVFRMTIALGRWTFPLIELEGARSRKVRAFVSAVLLAVIGSLVHDFVRSISGR